ncbi:MAG: 2-dehydropantoate 2-reductase [Thermoleophilia bacterium]|nr:2-dehydropantoate 2-reductase [Gaiellaceae bacterium]MDW8338368.1 2-dehydropantoate 2-reductase [Thermoleophilia bacterium]
MSSTVAVLGPGAVGGALAVRLALAGHRVVVIGPPETIGLVALAGIVVESRDGTLSARPEVRDRLTAPVRLLLVAVKAPALREALERIEPGAVADGVALALLNGIEHMELMRARLGERAAAGSVSHYQAYRPGRVQIVEASGPPLLTIASDTLPRGELEAAADLLRSARLEVRVGESEKRVLWHKLARIAPLAAATSATGRTIGELRGDPQWRDRLRQAVSEACLVASADGVALRPDAQLAIIDEIAAQTTTSAARDVAAGRLSELDAIVGAVLRAAERHGVETPALREIARAAGLP